MNNKYNYNLPYGEKILLHSCCAPCSSSVLESLTKDFNVTVFYFNPNIYPEEEFIKRQEEEKKFIKNVYGDKVKLIENDYNGDRYYDAVKGLENEKEGGKRCYKCFYLRLEETAKYAKQNGYKYFTTTLSVSPYKDYKVLNEIGQELAKKYELIYLSSNFKKDNGYLRSIQLSKEYNLYRQNYCGCVFSLNERKQRDLAKKGNLQ
jgi:epoxyqueuosine reductase